MKGLKRIKSFKKGLKEDENEENKKNNTNNKFTESYKYIFNLSDKKLLRTKKNLLKKSIKKDLNILSMLLEKESLIRAKEIDKN